jgi:hypothetical protein
MRHQQLVCRLMLSLVLLTAVLTTRTAAHRSGCHRWHQPPPPRRLSRRASRRSSMGILLTWSSRDGVNGYAISASTPPRQSIPPGASNRMGPRRRKPTAAWSGGRWYASNSTSKQRFPLIGRTGNCRPEYLLLEAVGKPILSGNCQDENQKRKFLSRPWHLIVASLFLPQGGIVRTGGIPGGEIGPGRDAGGAGTGRAIRRHGRRP